MSFDTALQRVQELGLMVDPTGGASAAASSAATGPAAGNGAAFAAALGAAQNRLGGDDETQLPESSDATGAPQLGMSDLINPQLADAVGGAPAAGPYGVPSLGGFGLDASSTEGGLGATYNASASLPANISPQLAMQLEAAGMTPYLYGAQGAGGVMGRMDLSGNVGERMVQLASSQVGVTEHPPGSNDGPQIRMYRSATRGSVNTPGPWCAYFVSWLASKAGAPVGVGGAGTGYVPTLENWGKQTGRWESASTTPRPGDIVTFNENGDNIADHTGIVERVDPDGTIHTIEGNSSNSVARRTYPAGSWQIRGFIHL
jgi:hypothetical protein